MDKTPLTAIDRRMLAQLEGLYGAPRAASVPRTSSASVAFGRHWIVALLRTTVLVGAATLLVTGTEPGRRIYGWAIDQLALIAALATHLLR